MKRYRRTFGVLVMAAFIGLIALAMWLWRPSVWVVLGVLFVFLLVDAFRADRRHE